MKYYNALLEIHTDTIVEVAKDIKKRFRRQFLYHVFLEDNIDPYELCKYVEWKTGASITGEVEDNQITFTTHDE